VGNVRTNVYAKPCCTPLRIKKALGIFRELITTITTITRPAFRVKNIGNVAARLFTCQSNQQCQNSKWNNKIKHKDWIKLDKITVRTKTISSVNTKMMSGRNTDRRQHSKSNRTVVAADGMSSVIDPRCQ